jgi:hypothetical protein
LTGAFCRQCGAEVGAARFCDQCGAPQEVAHEPAVAHGTADVAAARPRRRGRRYAAVAAVALVVAGVAAFVLLRGSDADAAPGSRTPPGATATGVTYPIGTEVYSLVASGETVWATTGRSKKWGGLTRLSPGEPRFWPFPEAARDDFRGQLIARPDGEAWLVLNDKTVALVRASGALQRFRITGGDLESTTNAVAAAPDGDLWIVTDKGRMLSVDERGGMRWSTVELPPADDDDSCGFISMAVESESAFWLSDSGCQRVIRVLNGSGEVYSLASDDPDGIPLPGSIAWTRDQRLLFVTFAGKTPRLGEITADHTVTPIVEHYARDIISGDPLPQGVFAGEKGGAWMTLSESCTAAEVVGTDTKTFSTPFPPRLIQPAGKGELWVAGATRIERIPIAGAGGAGDCDLKEPDFTAVGFEDGSISLDELERDGIVLKVDEPSLILVNLIFSDDSEQANFGTIEGERTLTRPGTVRIDVPADYIRRARERLRSGERPMLSNLSEVHDASGNSGYDVEGPGASTYLTD